MNQDRIQGRWKLFKGKVREQWGKLTDDDLDVIAGRRDQLLGRIQSRGGVASENAAGPTGRQRANPGLRSDETTDKTR
ncbi:MAG: CsbD family protein [Ramlibacter sp.]|jgi:uncharacterized protein YjbJ (UPF0337 family)|nr:CsbD family protein [Ramlibacter sp.]